MSDVCENCVHRNVCAHRNDFEKFVKEIDSITTKAYAMKFKSEPKCIYFKPNSVQRNSLFQ
ncbi:hypothetical protein CB457P1_00104 [Enterocloster phage CB457P1]|jgi:hypothetical protein|nr:hypothetical protein CB457P1_00104 [Enterocloster phage CB457P1]